jgi:hypothetical protein
MKRSEEMKSNKRFIKQGSTSDRRQITNKKYFPSNYSGEQVINWNCEVVVGILKDALVSVKCTLIWHIWPFLFF